MTGYVFPVASGGNRERVVLFIGTQRDGIARIRLAAESGERRARVGEGVHANAEPRHAVAAQDAENAKRQNDGQRHAHRVDRPQPSEVGQDHHRDERPQDHEELALGNHVGLAGLIDQLGNLAHGAVYRQVLELHVNGESEEQSEAAEDNSDQQNVVAIHAEEADGGQIGDLKGRFTSGLARLSECGGSLQHEKCASGGKKSCRIRTCYRRQPPQGGEPAMHIIPPMNAALTIRPRP